MYFAILRSFISLYISSLCTYVSPNNQVLLLPIVMIYPYSTETCSNIAATFQCCILQFNVAEILRRLLFAILFQQQQYLKYFQQKTEKELTQELSYPCSKINKKQEWFLSIVSISISARKFILNVKTCIYWFVYKPNKVKDLEE